MPRNLAPLALAFLLAAPARPARAEDAAAAAVCGKVLPAAAVSKALGKKVALSGGMSIGLVSVCTFKAGQLPVVSLQVSPKLTKAQYEDLYVKTAKGTRKPLAGAGDEAFTSTFQNPIGTMTYAVVRKGSAALSLGPGMDPNTGKALASDREIEALARAAKL